jgi:hypothetical protein
VTKGPVAAAAGVFTFLTVVAAHTRWDEMGFSRPHRESLAPRLIPGDTPRPESLRIDHVVVGASDLDRGMDVHLGSK